MENGKLPIFYFYALYNVRCFREIKECLQNGEEFESFDTVSTACYRFNTFWKYFHFTKLRWS